MEDVELDEVQWRSPEWIQTFGLSTENILDYFALSPFYDRSSNNQVLKMQTNFNEQLHRGPAELAKELQNMRGIEFVVAMSQEPDMWIIRKQNRRGPHPNDVVVMATYFVVGDNVYQSPSVYNVVASRILATSLCLGEGLRVAQELPTFTSSGYTYIPGPRDSTGSKDNTKDSSNPNDSKDTTSYSAGREFERSLEIASAIDRQS